MSDLISRQAAIDYFVINVGFHDEDGYPIEDTDELRKIWTEYFNGIPPAEPKHGKWVKISPANIYECSECGKNVMTNDICAYDFCHGCGAKMEVNHGR